MPPKQCHRPELKLKRIHIARFFAFIVAIQVLNLSIDAQSFQFLETKHTIGYPNEINSFVEYVAEIVLEHTNALPEYEKSSHDKLQLHKDCIVKHITVEDKKSVTYSDLKNDLPLAIPENYTCLFCKEINPPPPKA